MVSLSRIVTKLLLRGERASTLIFFLVSAGLELLCFLLHLLVRRSRFVRHHTVRPRDGQAGPRGYRVHHDVAAGDVCFMSPAGAPGLLPAPPFSRGPRAGPGSPACLRPRVPGGGCVARGAEAAPWRAGAPGRHRDRGGAARLRREGLCVGEVRAAGGPPNPDTPSSRRTKARPWPTAGPRRTARPTRSPPASGEPTRALTCLRPEWSGAGPPSEVGPAAQRLLWAAPGGGAGGGGLEGGC